MAFFIWTKMQTESGVNLPAIIALKEMERIAGEGEFWWGVGSAPSRSAMREAIDKSNGTLPILFSIMLSRPQKKDVAPGDVYSWTAWEDDNRISHPLPEHVLAVSRGRDEKKSHNALVCRSSVPIAIGNHGPFDPSRCQNRSGRSVGASQVTALLQGDIDGDHSPGIYHFGFRATLIEPWVVKLVKPRKLLQTEMNLLEGWRQTWIDFVGGNRSLQSRRSTG